MLNRSIFPDRNGSWVWEVLDDDVVYLRSDRSFVREHDAEKDLNEATHLIRSQLN